MRYLCFIHFHDPDTIGHKYGAHSAEKIQALADCDAALKTIRDAITDTGLIDSSVIILTADHGSHDLKNRERRTVATHGSAETADITIPRVAWGNGVKRDYDIPTPVLQQDTAATALWLLDVPLPKASGVTRLPAHSNNVRSEQRTDPGTGRLRSHIG